MTTRSQVVEEVRMNCSTSRNKNESQQGVLALLQARVEKFGEREAFRMKEGTSVRSLSYKELSKRAQKLSSYLLESGFQPQQRAAILCESRPEWAIAFFAAIRAGATVVPLDIKLTETELSSILSDCVPIVLFADSKHLELALKVQAKVPSIKHVYLLEDGKGNQEIKSIDQLEPKEIHQGVERQLDEVAVFVYTSGTTGSPKGVMTSFGNLIFQISSFQDIVDLSENDRFLSILPLNHLLELTGGFLGILNLGGTVCFCHSLFPQEIIRTMKEEKITGMIAVPLFYKSLRSGIEREVKRKGEEALKQFRDGLAKAEQLPMETRRQIFAPVLQELGGCLRVFISGGAPLEKEVGQFFLSLGLPMLEGYGLTETSPVIAGNSLRASKLGSVGQALPGVEVKIDKKTETDSEGEILTRGPHVMKGYHKREDLTKETIDSEGWLHTGDIGHLDQDGFLYITGRIKNMIVLGGGKKIFPEEVEAALANASTVKELCVLGKKSSDGFKEGSEEVCAVAVPSDALLHEFKDDKQAILQAIKKELDELAEHLASYKRPSKIFISMDELPKTVTRKVKRPAVLEWLKAQG
ncbi:MAG: AMP-binding protein [Candidatus Obscuribacterales bacterium]|nr:AMP-binding protein [Candidatus Obscuribacterales bacterium]